ncbi:uncharacterized protein H6S33_000230 [Morchella sextelata]|uniref:uncharacterized protein n=1 Tax=Morchella sextelata TaxID=1174677 RepID=UPI001D04A723|nr:uncharacterized protein H6S33_000230 [Morchella sextelata]KAH0614594.1 hypothetical protein H6S33_000230 [Morchella sextelata]
MPSPHRSTSRPLPLGKPSSAAPAAPAAPLLLPSDDPATFLTLMADTLRLSSETLTMAYVYIHRYKRWCADTDSAAADSSPSPDSAGADTDARQPVSDLLDEHNQANAPGPPGTRPAPATAHQTLSLASLSLATKATESPRRLREFLIPAYTLQHPTSPPLTFPSPLYDALRSTLVTAELLLLRVLRFELRLPLPYEYLPRLLERALTLSDAPAAEEERLECRVVDWKDTALGRAVWVKVAQAMTRYRVCNFFPARAVAAACVYYVAVVERGLRAPGGAEVWVRRVAGERVEWEDFVDALEEIRALTAV